MSHREQRPPQLSLPRPTLNNPLPRCLAPPALNEKLQYAKRSRFSKPHSTSRITADAVHFPKRKGIQELPTHSNRVIWRATVLWTRNGRPEPLPEVHEWSSNSCNGKQGEKEITKIRLLLWGPMTPAVVTSMSSSSTGHVTLPMPENGP